MVVMGDLSLFFPGANSISMFCIYGRDRAAVDTTYSHEVRFYIEYCSHSIFFTIVFSYLKFYTTMPLAKLAAFMDIVSCSLRLCGIYTLV